MAVKFLQQRRMEEHNNAIGRIKSKDVTRVRQGIKSCFYSLFGYNKCKQMRVLIC